MPETKSKSYTETYEQIYKYYTLLLSEKNTSLIWIQFNLYSLQLY